MSVQLYCQIIQMSNPSPSLPNNVFLKLISKQKKIFTNMIDALLADDGVTTECKLIFENLKCDTCINCFINPITGKSNGIYKTDGPVLFKKGMICPVCAGLGKVQIDQPEELINMAVIFDSKKFYGFGAKLTQHNTQIPKAFAQTICRVELYHKIKNTREAVLNNIMEFFNHSVYQRITEPELIGFGVPQYIITTWQLIQA